MRCLQRFVSSLFALIVHFALLSVVQAQSANGAGALAAPPPSETATEDGADEEDEGQDEEEKSLMGEFGLTVKLGMAHVNAGDVPNPFYSAAAAQAAAQNPALAEQFTYGAQGCTIVDRRCKTASRFGLMLALALHTGGDGFGWDLEPYIAFAEHAKAFGVYTGPKFDIHVADPVYVGFGFGVKGAYLKADGWAGGADIAGRIPIHATYYVIDDLALTAEFAFGAGATGYVASVAQEIEFTDPTSGRTVKVGSAPELTFGVARTWDLTFGVRFP